MKSSLTFSLILIILVHSSYQINNVNYQEQITSLDPSTVKSPGNFLNVSHDATEIITPQYAEPKLNIDLLKKKTHTNCDGSKETYIEHKSASLNLDTNKIIKPDETVDKFGISTIDEVSEDQHIETLTNDLETNNNTGSQNNSEIQEDTSTTQVTEVNAVNNNVNSNSTSNSSNGNANSETETQSNVVSKRNNKNLKDKSNSISKV